MKFRWVANASVSGIVPDLQLLKASKNAEHCLQIISEYVNDGIPHQYGHANKHMQHTGQSNYDKRRFIND